MKMSSMELVQEKKMSKSSSLSSHEDSASTCKVVDSANDHDEDDVPLPGFRFHPTDEELVGFYLRRKVEKRPISIELIKQVDIYKYDPWDLPKASNVGDKEWYFFCKRGRKYRNSIRPNRVTGSGFWKATGIDRPIYSAGGDGRECVGLKKSLVYYRGSAGKGTKTDWMMHEFRLPADQDDKSTKHMDVKSIMITQEAAEVWTLCRIFKRNVSYRKCIPDWRESSSATKRSTVVVDHHQASSKTCSVESDSTSTHDGDNYIDFRAPVITLMNKQNHHHHHHHPDHHQQPQKKHFVVNQQPGSGGSGGTTTTMININTTNMQKLVAAGAGQLMSSHLSHHQAPSGTPSAFSNFFSPADANEFVKYGDWDELRSVVEFAYDPFVV